MLRLSQHGPHRGVGKGNASYITVTDLLVLWVQFFAITGFGFSKQNELFVGRVAQLGFAAALIGEAITGVGPLAQLGLETGIPLRDAEPIILLSVLFILIAAINEVCTLGFSLFFTIEMLL